MIDSKSATLLSDFFLDMSKAYFIATFISPQLSNSKNLSLQLEILIKGILTTILLLVLARRILNINK
jgi:uncharacterized integral membrane protein